MEELKIYGLCLERLRYQIGNVKMKTDDDGLLVQERFLLESYNTADIDDIIDILELYDVEENTSHHVREKLADLAYTVSLLLCETITFDITDNGHLGLYLLAHEESLNTAKEEAMSPVMAGMNPRA